MKKLQNKLQEKLKNRKQNNKGFSLVELIIVIAIMAILVGIVGTQVIPYIEKSRKAKDIQVVSGLCTDAMTAYSSNAAKLDANATYTITLTAPTTGTAWGVAVDGGIAAEKTALQDAFTELNNVNTTGLKFESKAGKEIGTITVTCQNTAPMISVQVAPKSGATTLTAANKDDFKVESN